MRPLRFSDYTRIRDNLLPSRLSISLVMVPLASARSYADISWLPDLPMRIVISPALTSDMPVTSTSIWSIQMRPMIGASWSFIRTCPWQQESARGIPSAYPMERTAIFCSSFALYWRPYPTASPACRFLVSEIWALIDRTGFKWSGRFSRSDRLLNTL